MSTEIDGLGDPRGTASRAGARVTPWSASLVSFLPKQERYPPEASAQNLSHPHLYTGAVECGKISCGKKFSKFCSTRPC